MAPPRSSAGSSRRHRSTLSMQKTEILINVYDLLPPGRLSSILWTVGAGLLHSAVVINGKEYAYGGHDHKNLTGVYWTRPKTEPPGGTFRCEILHGFTLASDEEIENVIREASEEFQGTAYNLLTRNCNHFTSYLCQKLTGTPGPAWLNRAAAIGVAFPCVVPQEWIEPPDYDTAEGALLGEEPVDERARMLGKSQDAPHILGNGSRSNEEWAGDSHGSGSKGKRQYSVSQTSLG